MSDILILAILGSQQLRSRVEQTVPCRNWNSAQAMGDYVMSRRCNGGHSKFCSLVSRFYDRESSTKKLNRYATTWDVSSNIEYNVNHILKFQFESIYSRPGSRDSCISDHHRTLDCWPQPLEQWIMKRNIESSICFPHLQVVESAGLRAFFPTDRPRPNRAPCFPCGCARILPKVLSWKVGITYEQNDTKVNSSSDRLKPQKNVQCTDTKKVQVCLAISEISPNICLREFAGACNTYLRTAMLPF